MKTFFPLLRDVEAQRSINGIAAFDIANGTDQAGVAQLLDAAVAKAEVAVASLVAQGFIPFGARPAIGQIDRVAGGVIVLAGKFKTGKAPVGGEDVIRF